MAKDIRYVGAANAGRIVRDSDFARAGLVQETLTWDKTNQFTILNVAEPVALYLLALAPEDFIDMGGQTFAQATKVQYGDNGLYVPEDWGKHIMPVLAGPGVAVVSAFGDSGCQGVGATMAWKGGWIARLRDALQAKYGDGGSGFLTSMDAPGAMFPGNAGRQVVAGTWALHATDGGPGGGLFIGASAGATYTEPVVKGRYIDVFWGTNPANGNLEVRIDGVLVGTLVGAVAVANFKTTYDRGADKEGTSCVVELRNVSAALTFVYGIAGRNSAGVQVNNMAKWGETSGLAIAPAFGGATISNSIAGHGITNFAPDLMIYEMGGNDHSVATVIDTYRSNMRFALNAAKMSAKAGKCDVLFVAIHDAENDLVANNYDKYVREMKDVAEATGSAFINHWGRGDTYYNYMDDMGYSASAGNIHPNNAGYQWMAQPVIELLGADLVAIPA